MICNSDHQVFDIQVSILFFVPQASYGGGEPLGVNVFRFTLDILLSVLIFDWDLQSKNEKQVQSK